MNSLFCWTEVRTLKGTSPPGRECIAPVSGQSWRWQLVVLSSWRCLCLKKKTSTSSWSWKCLHFNEVQKQLATKQVGCKLGTCWANFLCNSLQEQLQRHSVAGVDAAASEQLTSFSKTRFSQRSVGEFNSDINRTESRCGGEKSRYSSHISTLLTKHLPSADVLLLTSPCEWGSDHMH